MIKIEHDLYNMWGFDSQKESHTEKVDFSVIVKLQLSCLLSNKHIS